MVGLKEALKGRIPEEKLRKVISSFDIVGDIAIIQIPKELEDIQDKIAEAIFKLHKNVKVVLKKVGIHRGIFRRQRLRIVAGERRKVTECRESGVRIRLHVEDVYFSPRLATERARIASQVNPGERVLVMFSGVAPYCLVIAKKSRASEVYGIEINPVAHQFALKNVALNKLHNIKLFLGDVRIVVPMLGMRFDRIVMPLPLGGENFLDTALSVIKDGGTIHFYDFKDEAGFEIAKMKVRNACKAAGKRCRILRLVKCGQIGPRTYRICIDFKVFGRKARK